MIQTIGKSQFIDAFGQMGRQDQFSYEGLRALYDYLEDYEEATGCSVELDVIAFCCEFTEYEDLEEIQDNYSDIESIDDLRGHTTVIIFNSGIIIADY